MILLAEKKCAVQLLDPVTELPMSNKQTDDHINTFVSSVTNDFPEVRDEWLAYGELVSLTLTTEESVAKKLKVLNVGKAAGPHDPCMKLIKLFLQLIKFICYPIWLTYTMNHFCQDPFQKFRNFTLYVGFQKLLLVRMLINCAANFPHQCLIRGTKVIRGRVDVR